MANTMKAPMKTAMGPRGLLFCLSLAAIVSTTFARTTDDTHRSQRKYYWKSGEWGACFSSPALCGEGRRERPVWCAEADGRTVLQFLCDPSAEPPSTKPCFLACRHHKDKLQWQVGPWGPCLPAVPSGDGQRTSEVIASLASLAPDDQDADDAAVVAAVDATQGVTQRNVTCVLLSSSSSAAGAGVAGAAAGRPVDEENCLTASRKPDAARLCHIPKPQDCVVGPFQAWSTCPRGCPGDDDEEDDGGNAPRGVRANQTRVRSVLVAPLHGGKPCPPLAEHRPCPARPAHACPPRPAPGAAHSPAKPQYRLKLGEWRRCQPPSAVVAADAYSPIVGGPSVIHAEGAGPAVAAALTAEASPGSEPVPHAAALRHPPPDSPDFPPGPLLSGPLGVGAAGGPGVGAGGSSGEDGDSYYAFQPSVGLQTRDVSCRDPRGATVQLSLCLGESMTTLPPRVRSCVVPQDCVVSQWSAWTRVQDGCVAAGGRARPEVQVRKRSVARPPEGEGRPCPHLQETRRSSDRDSLPPCAHKYRWLASKWSPCVVTSDEPPPTAGAAEAGAVVGGGVGGGRTLEVGCGGGVQLREVTCVTALSGRPVSPELCSSLQPLPTVQRCEVACPRDCEMGEWGEWGPCRPLDCPHIGEPPAEGYRERRRAVLVHPSEQGVACPSQTEVQPCPQPACHRWVDGPWGPCELRPGVKRCGDGRRSRLVACRTIYGAPADESACLRLRPRPDDEEPCLLPCPFDCVLSPWSEWSPCSHACSSPRQAALRQRNRTVIAPPGPGGHPCPDPDEMLQIEACNTHSCHGYSWLSLPWQPCRPPPGETFSTEAPPPPPVIGPLDEEGFEAAARAAAAAAADNAVALVANTTDPPTDCGRGVQERDVWCMEANDRRVEDDRCNPLPKPMQRRPCQRPCPVDCQMSPWSEWSPCPQHCVPDASGEARGAGEVTPTQARTRVVLRWPRHGGASCPPAEELRPCPLSGARCRHYMWAAGDWSECRLPQQLKCGLGYRTRPVWCYRNHPSSRVEPSLCYEHNGTAPAQHEPCTVDCALPCVLSSWGAWTPCRHACSARTRTRQLLGLSAARDACRNATRFPLQQATPCPCERFALAPEGPWSECVLERAIRGAGAANGRGGGAGGSCGAGTRTRRAACRDKTGALVEPSLCGVPSGLQEEPCLVPCPADCLLSPWTPWGACSSLCGPGVQTRTRRELRPAADGGRPCGALIETKLCREPCEQFKWVAAGWGECQLIGPDRAKGCGTGDQYRRVRCMRFRPHALPEEVEDAYCDPVAQPPDVNACHVACPGDCVLSPWSDWSECPKPCEASRERQRTRSVLRGPATAGNGASSGIAAAAAAAAAANPTSETGQRCPPLIEVQACRLNVTCFTYSWVASDFSSCLPLGGSPCGEGVQQRAVYCRRSDGRPVPDSFCADQDRPAPTEKWCYVDCPVDCEVSSWTPWNASQCRCGDVELPEQKEKWGQQTRRRHVLTASSPRGRPCPLPLLQTRPCPARPCYAWDVGPWGSCDLNGAFCGHGVMKRDVRCLRDSVTAVETRLCRRESRRRAAAAAAAAAAALSGGFIEPGEDPLEMMTPALLRPEELRSTDSCYVPCRGDCHLSEWSRWSHCHRDCRGGGAGSAAASAAGVAVGVGGYQTRSRAVLRGPAPGGEPCPTALWETRPCFAGACLSFDWALASDGSLQCRRSDGVIVIGGCDGRPRPCSARARCEAAGARCDAASGRCACPAGTAPRAEAGRLVSCDASAPSIASAADGGPAGPGAAQPSLQGHGRHQPLQPLQPALGGLGGDLRRRRPGEGHADGPRIHDDTAEIQSRFYYPNDDDVNVWMFAMIGIGCVFIVFVAVSLYIMCYRKSDDDCRYPDSQQKVL